MRTKIIRILISDEWNCELWYSLFKLQVFARYAKLMTCSAIWTQLQPRFICWSCFNSSSAALVVAADFLLDSARFAQAIHPSSGVVLSCSDIPTHILATNPSALVWSACPYHQLSCGLLAPTISSYGLLIPTISFRVVCLPRPSLHHRLHFFHLSVLRKPNIVPPHQQYDMIHSKHTLGGEYQASKWKGWIFCHSVNGTWGNKALVGRAGVWNRWKLASEIGKITACARRDHTHTGLQQEWNKNWMEWGTKRRG